VLRTSDLVRRSAILYWMRIAVGELSHETNTFCAGLTTVTEFKKFMWLRGDDIVRVHQGNRTYIGGMLDSAAELGITAVPTFGAMAYPSGTIARANFAQLLDELVSAIKAAMPVDGVALSLHGAGVAEGDDDIEATILKSVRELVGPDVPIAATLDLHGNITSDMLRYATGLFGVNYYPHVDSYERGREAVEFLRRVHEGNLRPVMHLESLPMMIAPTTTDLDPAKRFNEMAWEMEDRPKILDCTIFHGFPMTDVPAVGVSVLVMADDDVRAAQSAASQLASAIWEARDEYKPEILDPAQAIGAALAHEGAPIVINDTSDNPGGGSPGDSTHLLRAMVGAQLDNACYAFIYDPETVTQAASAGVGASIDIRLGGKSDSLHGTPIEVRAYVKALTDGRFRYSTPMWRGLHADLGPMARLQIGGIHVLVSSSRQQTLDEEVFLLNGIDVRRYKIVALKSSQHFRAGFNEIASKIIAADAPGATSLQIEKLPHKRIRRPIWPLDEKAAYVEAGG
jgi:microcystin degradation protein MlrC